MKAKHRTKKALSMLLAAVMVLTMIPFGMLVTFAEGIDDLWNATEEAYIVDSAQDWATVAAASNGDNKFDGKIVKLGAEITGVTAPLFPKDFKGTFDGAGMTVKDSTVNGNALIAVSASGAAQIKNLTVSNVTLTPTGDNAGLIVGNVTGGTPTVSGVTITGCTVTVSNKAQIGGLVGHVSGGTLTVNNCDVNANVTGGWQTAILIGQVNGGNLNTNTDNDTSVIRVSGSANGVAQSGIAIGSMQSGTVSLKGVQVDGATFTVGSSGKGGGLVGRIGGTGNLTVKDCSVKNVTIDAKCPYLGGAIGFVQNTAGTVSIDGCALSNVTVVTSLQNAYGLGGVIGHSETNQSVSVKNVTMNQVTVGNDYFKDNPSKDNATEYIGGIIGYLKGSGAYTVDGVTDTGAVTLYGSKTLTGGVGGVVAWYEASAGTGKLTVKNINLSQLDIDFRSSPWASNQGNSVTAGASGFVERERNGAGGLIGFYLAHTTSDLELSNIKLAGTVDGLRPADNAPNAPGDVGGLIGSVTEASAYNYTAYDKYAGSIDIANVEMLLTITSAIKGAYQGTGALIGAYGQSANAGILPDLHGDNAVVNIRNTVIGGSLTTATQGAAAIVGYGTISGATFNISNTLFTGNITKTATDNGPAGLIFGRYLRPNVKLNLTNCSTTSDALALGGDLGEQKGWVNNDGWKTEGPTITLNGIAYTAVASGANATENTFKNAFTLQKDALALVSEEEAGKMITRDTETGFITEVDGHLVGAYEQHSGVYEKGGKDVYNIRFITLTHLSQTEGFKIVVRAKTADDTTDQDILFDDLQCNAYAQLLGQTGLIDNYQYTAESLGGQSFIAVVITGVQKGVNYDFEITASYTTEESSVTMTDRTRTFEVRWEGDVMTTNATPVA